MAGRDMPRSPDPDDWFAEPEGVAPRRDRVGARSGSPGRASAAPDDEDDWIAESTGAPPRRRSRLADSLPDRWVAIAAGAVLIVTLIVGGLALAGVFSGSTSKPAVATTVASSPTTAPTTTQSSAPAVPAPTTTLKPGDTGAQVKALQRALVHLGYSVGKVDGDYGTSTESAVKQFQRATKLTADGVFGPATRAALVKALRTS